MKILLTPALLLLLISGHGCYGYNTDMPHDNSDLRRLGNTPQPGAFKAAIPFLHGMESPSADAPLIPKRPTLDPRVDPQGSWHGPPMGGGPLMDHGPMMGPPPPPNMMGVGPGGPMMGGPPPPNMMGGPPPNMMGVGPPTTSIKPMGPGSFGGGVGSPTVRKGGGLNEPPFTTKNNPNPPPKKGGPWGMPDMLRGRDPTRPIDEDAFDHVEHPMQGVGDGFWQNEFKHLHGGAPFQVPRDFLSSAIDPDNIIDMDKGYHDDGEKYEPLVPEDFVEGFDHDHEIDNENYDENEEFVEGFDHDGYNHGHFHHHHHHFDHPSNMRMGMPPPGMEQYHHPPPNIMPNFEQPPPPHHPNMPLEDQPYGSHLNEEFDDDPFFHHHIPQQPPPHFHHHHQERRGHHNPNQQGRKFNTNRNVWPYNVNPPVRYDPNGYVPMDDPNSGYPSGGRHHPMDSYHPMEDYNDMLYNNNNNDAMPPPPPPPPGFYLDQTQPQTQQEWWYYTNENDHTRRQSDIDGGLLYY